MVPISRSNSRCEQGFFSWQPSWTSLARRKRLVGGKGEIGEQVPERTNVRAHSPRYSSTTCVIARRRAAAGTGDSATATCGLVSVTDATHSISAYGRVGFSPDSSKRSFIFFIHRREPRNTCVKWADKRRNWQKIRIKKNYFFPFFFPMIPEKIPPVLLLCPSSSASFS